MKNDQSNQPIIDLYKVSKTFRVRKKSSSEFTPLPFGFRVYKSSIQEINALSNVTLQVYRGEKVGIIGRNGSGKSTLIRMIMAVLKPDKGGFVKTNGSIMKLETGLGFDKELRAIDNIALNSSLIGLSNNDLEERYRTIIEFAELDTVKDLPIKYYSKGMKSRLSFATAMFINPDLILLDEFFGGGGDIKFKKKSDRLFEERILEDKTLVIVSHNLSVISEYCDRAIWLDKGQIIMEDSPDKVCKEYELAYK